MSPTFSQNLTIQDAFETAAQTNEELKITEFDHAKIQTSNGCIFLIFSLNVENR